VSEPASRSPSVNREPVPTVRRAGAAPTILVLVAILLLSAAAGAVGGSGGTHLTSEGIYSHGRTDHSPADSPASQRPADGTVNPVLNTLDLAANRLLAGNQQPAVVSAPQTMLYDPANGDFYVRGSAGESISVVNASADQVLTSFSASYAGNAYVPGIPTMALDTATGDLFELNPSLESIGVVSTATNLPIGSIRMGAAPGGIVFDPSNGNLYTSNWGNDNVSVVSGSTLKVVAAIPVGGEPGALLYDPTAGEVFVSNFQSGNVSVIDTGTEAVVANPVTGLRSAEPVALALDTDDDLVSVVNSVTGNISVINASTYSVRSVPVGSVPEAVAYDSSTDTLLVANGASNNVTVLQQPADTPIASLPIGHGVQGAALDSSNGYLYTANYGANNVSIVDATSDTVIGSVTTGNFPMALAVDTASGNVFVANEGTSSSDANLTVISGSTSLSIASVRLVATPTSLVTAPNGDLYATDYGGQGTFVISEATGLATGFAATPPEPSASAYDPVTGDLFIASEPSGAVTVVSGAGTFVGTVGLGFGSYGVAYDAADAEVYVSNYYSGNVTIIDAATLAVTKVISVVPFDSVGAELYDPASDAVYVADYFDDNVTVMSATGTNGSIPVGTSPSSFAYDPQNNTIFVANYGSGTITVINASTNRAVTNFSGYFPQYLAYDSGTNALCMVTSENGQVDAFNATTYDALLSPVDINSSVRAGGIAYSPITGDIYVSNEFDSSISTLANVEPAFYAVTFDETGLPASTNWGVTLGGAPNASNSATVGFSEPNGSYPYSVAAVPGYTANVTTGSVIVTGRSVTVEIGFSPNAAAGAYPVWFNESGLPAATLWQVTLEGTAVSGTNPSIGFSETNGTYPFTVGTVSGYAPNVTGGDVIVAGAPQTVLLEFTPTQGTRTYPVTFNETGLPGGTSWTVGLAPSEGVGASSSDAPAPVVLDAPNGTYTFTVGAVVGYSASPSSSSIIVAGAPAYRTIDFAAGAVALTVVLGATPSQLTLGASTTLTTSASGGSPPYSYAYSGLPAGCASADTASLICTPSALGTFNVSVTVTDHSGSQATAHSTVTVVGGPGTAVGGGLTTLDWALIAVGILIVVGLILLFLVGRRRRRDRREPPPVADSPSTAPPSRGVP
jgi:YVTN family beta-propeller protein